MTANRRGFFSRMASWSAAALATHQVFAQPEAAKDHHHAGAPPPVRDTGHAVAKPVVTPDVSHLPYRTVNGVKEFNLIAEVVHTTFMDGKNATGWGYNGSIPGPTIEIDEGDRVRILFENRLPEPTSMHWHGLEVPIEMDGIPGISQKPVFPGQKFVYEFTLNQHGTFFYHSHMAMQEMMGLIGFFIIRPKSPSGPPVHRDFGLILQEWAILPNNEVPNSLAMEFNWLTFNGKASPATTPIVVQQGERVRIRLVNLGMDHHPIHLHGNQFVVTGTEAGRIPEHLWFNQNTVLVGVAQARDIEFEAKYPGDWMLHCHMPHHMMNQMASMVGPVAPMQMGLQTGGGMEEGMGMIRQGGPLSDDLGPSLGRDVGISADREKQVPNSLNNDAAAAAHVMAGGHQHAGMHAGADSTDEMYPKNDSAKKKIPGYPQDMWMPMDAMAGDRPEFYGLPPGWTGGMMGMMTLVRVVTPEVFQKIEQLRARQSNQPSAPMEHMHHHGTGGGSE